jgi:hypothetical protein
MVIEFLLIIFVTGLSISSMASDYGVVAGIRIDDATTNSANTSIVSDTNYMAGVVGTYDIHPQLQIRSGFFLTIRRYDVVPLSGVEGETNLQSFDIPLGILWKVSDYGGPFIGANLSLTAESTCPAGKCSSVASMPTGLQLGAQFKFAQQLGAAFYYETMGYLVDKIDNPKAIVAQLIITFD